MAGCCVFFSGVKDGVGGVGCAKERAGNVGDMAEGDASEAAAALNPAPSCCVVCGKRFGETT